MLPTASPIVFWSSASGSGGCVDFVVIYVTSTAAKVRARGLGCLRRTVRAWAPALAAQVEQQGGALLEGVLRERLHEETKARSAPGLALRASREREFERRRSRRKKSHNHTQRGSGEVFCAFAFITTKRSKERQWARDTRKEKGGYPGCVACRVTRSSAHKT